MTRLRYFAFALSLGTLAGFIVGCGEGGPPMHIVKGKILYKGLPMPVKPMVGRLGVEFYPADSKTTDPFDVVVEADGSFTVRGHKGKGIPEGKYKVAVEWKDDYPLGNDKLKGMFTLEKTKIIRQIPSKDPIEIDVSKAEG